MPTIRSLLGHAWLAAGAARRRLREPRLKRRDERFVASLRGRHDLKLNIGSSSEHIDGWISADLYRDPAGRCLRMDATQPWPFDDGAAAAILLEHVIEHIELDQLPDVLREAHRVLAPGGVLRICVPGLDGLAQAFADRDPQVLEAHRGHGYEARTHGDMLNNYAYLWGHRHLWDAESLGLRLTDAGFTDIQRTAFGESSHAIVRGVDQHDPAPLGDLVLCMDAVRPV